MSKLSQCTHRVSNTALAVSGVLAAHGVGHRLVDLLAGLPRRLLAESAHCVGHSGRAVDLLGGWRPPTLTRHVRHLSVAANRVVSDVAVEMLLLLLLQKGGRRRGWQVIAAQGHFVHCRNGGSASDWRRRRRTRATSAGQAERACVATDWGVACKEKRLDL